VLLPLNSLKADILRDLRRHGDLCDHCCRLGSRPKSRRCGGRLRRLASFLDRLGLLLRLARLASFSPWKVIVISRFHLRFVGLHDVEDESLRLFDGDVEGLAASAKRRDAVVCSSARLRAVRSLMQQRDPTRRRPVAWRAIVCGRY
jgi:hypothetical protein